MSTKLKAGTATSGAVIDADTTGILELQSGSTPTTAVTIDASQNVGIGTSPSVALDVSSTANSASGQLRIASNGSNGTRMGFISTSTNGKTYQIGSNFVTGTGEFAIYNLTDATTRLLIDSSGRLLLGTTTPLNTSYRLSVTGSAGGVWIQGSNAGDAVVVAESKGAAWNFYGINDAAANTFYVLKNGDVRNTNNSYGAISDIKLKENIVDATPKLDDLMKVKVRHYNLIGDSSKQIGVVAQELEQVFPKLVETNVDMATESNPNPEPTKSVKYSVFVPMLIKAIQELNAKVEALEAQLGAK